MGTYDELSVGDRFTTPARALDGPTVQALVEAGGYTHPLFTDPAYAARSRFDRRPLPGQALLLIMGGLVEQTGRFDETVIALAGFEGVRFRAPAFEGDEVRVEVEVLGKEDRPRERGMLTMGWRCIDSSSATLVDARARMLFRRSGG